MSWFGKRSKKKHPEQRQVPSITFVGEQNGPVEQTLKNSFVDFFRRDQMLFCSVTHCNYFLLLFCKHFVWIILLLNHHHE